MYWFGDFKFGYTAGIWWTMAWGPGLVARLVIVVRWVGLLMSVVVVRRPDVRLVVSMWLCMARLQEGGLVGLMLDSVVRFVVNEWR